MPKPNSRAEKKVHYTAPGGCRRFMVKKKIKHNASCAICNTHMSSVSYSRKEKGKSSRKPSRMFGGYLCHTCTENLLRYKIWLKEKKIGKNEIPIEFKKYM
ncbi:MAG: hypothetical protein ACP5KJ_02840 [Candidatus Micrarchaeia archaeon]